MRTVTFLVLEGVDKGRVYRNLPVPVTLGREEGNALRLNDERVSRFHAKVQTEDGDIILTDLDSTNGTRVNGSAVQIRRLRAGDQISIGRSMLLFGTMEEIEARRASVRAPVGGEAGAVQTVQAAEVAAAGTSAFDLAVKKPAAELATGDGGDRDGGSWRYRAEDVPPLPQKLTGSQAARLAEVFDYLHRAVTAATEHIDANDDGTEVRLGFGEWQTVQAVQMMLARYSRQVAEPNGE